MKQYLSFTIHFLLILSFCSNIYSQKQVASKVLLNNYVKMNVNKISTYIYNDGRADVIGSNGGCTFPVRNSPVVYESDLLWGAKVGSTIKVGGSSYRTGLQPGKIFSSGTPTDPNAASARVYKVRRDYKTANLSVEAADEGVTTNTVFANYQTDWIEWPVNDGAPFEDVDKDGKYSANIDIPGVPGADVTIWYVANDMDPAKTAFLYGSTPLGIELQVTVWSYINNPLDDVIFKKYLLINKSIDTFTDMYISQWADPDIGVNPSDDFAGCDSLLNLGFAYESKNQTVASQFSPPAVGWYMHQGPIVRSSNASDIGLLNGKKRMGFKNLPMTSFYTFYNSAPFEEADPTLGDYNTGSIYYYNFFQGKTKTGGVKINPVSGKPTTFSFSGDPITGLGWLNTMPSDVRLGLVSGPFNLAAGDTQEVIVAFYGAVSSPQENGHLKNLTALKQKQLFLRNFLNNGVATFIVAPEFFQINQPLVVDLKFINANKADAISSIKWEYSKVPNSSNATISNSTQQQATLNFDVVGDYEIKLTVKTTLGFEIVAMKTILGINNQAPVAKIKLSKNEIEWGDSVLVKFDESFDLDNDNLTYEVSGYHGQMNMTTKSTYSYPGFGQFGPGKNYVTLKVSDKYSFSEITDSFVVKPKLVNVKFSYSYIDPDWGLILPGTGVRGNFFYKGKDTLLVPTQKGLKRYQLSGSSVEVKETYPIMVDGVWGIKNNLFFTAANNVSGYYGTLGKLSVYDMANNFNKVINDFSPNPSDIIGCSIYNNEVLLTDLNNIFYLVDLSSISIPRVKVSSSITNAYSIRRIKETDQFYYFFHRLTSSSTYHVSKLDRNTLTLVYDINTQIPSTRTIASSDSLLVAYTTSQDSAFVYRFESFDKVPKLVSTFLFSKYIKKMYTSLFPYLSYSISFMNKNILVLKSQYDRVVVNANKLINGSPISETVLAELGGFSSTFNFLDLQTNYYFNYGDNRYTAAGGYTGINRVTFDLISSVENTQDVLPTRYFLSQNYPNPFNPTTTIKYSIPQKAVVSISIYDLLGREVAVLVNEEKPAGNYSVKFNGSKLSSGVYFYRLQVYTPGRAGSFSNTKKFILLK